MARLTLVIDDDLFERARMRAVAQGTSVNAVVREMLADDAADERALDGRRWVAALARSSIAGRASTGRSWVRDELYDNRGVDVPRHHRPRPRDRRSCPPRCPRR